VQVICSTDLRWALYGQVHLPHGLKISKSEERHSPLLKLGALGQNLKNTSSTTTFSIAVATLWFLDSLHRGVQSPPSCPDPIKATTTSNSSLSSSLFVARISTTVAPGGGQYTSTRASLICIETLSQTLSKSVSSRSSRWASKCQGCRLKYWALFLPPSLD
jgi:hypothetical protein